MPYTGQEYAEMVRCFFENGGVLAHAADAYAERWPNRPRPNPRTIGGAHARFMLTGNANVPSRVDAGRPRHVLVPAVEEDI